MVKCDVTTSLCVCCSLGYNHISPDVMRPLKEETRGREGLFVR